MAMRVKFNREPDDDDLAWFSKNIGPRTHWLMTKRGGVGWEFQWDNDGSGWRQWFLTVDDEYGKILTYYLLMR